MRRLLIFALMMVVFCIAGYSAYRYGAVRRETINAFYEQKVRTETRDAGSGVISQKDVADAIRESVQGLNAILIVLVGGSLYLAAQKGMPKGTWDYIVSFLVFPLSVSSLSFSILNGLSVLHALVAALATGTKAMTDAPIQAYWDVQVELALFGTAFLTVQFIDYVATNWAREGKVIP